MTELGKAPRWFLLMLAGGFVTAAVGWAAHVEAHIEDSSHGYQRIAALEASVAAQRALIESLNAHASWCRRQHESKDGR